MQILYITTDTTFDNVILSAASLGKGSASVKASTTFFCIAIEVSLDSMLPKRWKRNIILFFVFMFTDVSGTTTFTI